MRILIFVLILTFASNAITKNVATVKELLLQNDQSLLTGMISGVVDTFIDANQICLPEYTNAEQPSADIGDTFGNYIKVNPSALDLPYPYVIFKAFRAKYPCKKSKN